MVPRTLITTCVVALAILLAGCSHADKPPTLTTAVKLPDDLCTTVPAGFTSTWGVVRSGGSTDNSSAVSRASCEMNGTREGAPVKLVISVTGYGDDGDQTASQRAKDAVRRRCAKLARTTDLTFERLDDGFCNAASGKAGSPRDAATYVMDAGPADAVIDVDLTWDKASYLRSANEAVGLVSDVRDAVLDAALAERDTD